MVVIKHDGINGARFSPNCWLRIADCVVLYVFALKLKAFSLATTVFLALVPCDFG